MLVYAIFVIDMPTFSVQISFILNPSESFEMAELIQVRKLLGSGEPKSCQSV